MGVEKVPLLGSHAGAAGDSKRARDAALVPARTRLRQLWLWPWAALVAERSQAIAIAAEQRRRRRRELVWQPRCLLLACRSAALEPQRKHRGLCPARVRPRENGVSRRLWQDNDVAGTGTEVEQPLRCIREAARSGELRLVAGDLHQQPGVTRLLVRQAEEHGQGVAAAALVLEAVHVPAGLALATTDAQVAAFVAAEQPPTDQEWDRPGSWCNSVI